VLVPLDRGKFSCCLKVPSDAHVVLQKWGKDHTPTDMHGEKAEMEDRVELRLKDGVVDPQIRRAPKYKEGFRCLCSWYRIAYLVTKQVCTYNVPVRNVPTADNVKVKVDVVLVFQIIDARSFVYNLGAHQMDELLHATTEEAVRNLVRHTTVNDLYEMRGSAAGELLDGLNSTFDAFGVVFSNCTITSVWMPEDLSKWLENTTVYEGRLEEEDKRFQFHMQQLLNRSEISQKRVDIANEMLAIRLDAQITHRKIEHEKEMIDSERQREVSVMEAVKESDIRKTKSQSELLVSKIEMEREDILRKTTSESSAAAEKIAADQESTTMLVRSSTDKEVAENDANMRKYEADAEDIASTMLYQKRTYDLEFERLEILEKLAQKGRLMVTGERGEKMIKSVLKSCDLKSPAKAKEID
jgi:regulator of protease activity HflC (stomatin/prohibitin superfamily)